MNRFRKAWQALRGTLEPEVKTVKQEVLVQVYVPVGDGIKTVYRANSKRYAEHRNWMRALRRDTYYLPDTVDEASPEWEGRLFESCAEAFSACGNDANVESVSAFVTGGNAYVLGKLTPEKIESAKPKPRVAKGRK